MANSSCVRVRGIVQEEDLVISGTALTLVSICSIAVVIHVADFGKRHSSITRKRSQALRADRGFQLYVTFERNRLSLALGKHHFATCC